MKRSWLAGLVLVGGCSTHPIVDVRDCLFPGRLTKEEVTPYGGVCRPQGPVGGVPPPAVTVGPPTAPVVPPAAAPGAPVVPPPVPLPPQTTPPPPPPGLPKF